MVAVRVVPCLAWSCLFSQGHLPNVKMNSQRREIPLSKLTNDIEKGGSLSHSSFDRQRDLVRGKRNLTGHGMAALVLLLTWQVLVRLSVP